MVNVGVVKVSQSDALFGLPSGGLDERAAFSIWISRVRHELCQPCGLAILR
jgi:hypothetical protein